MSGTKRSAVVIARMLGVEGYDAHTHNAVAAYWKREVMNPERTKGVAKTEAKFHKLVEELDLNEKERMVLGRFISLRSQMAFDSGLRIGITAHAHLHDKTISDLFSTCERSDRA